ncbi:DUF6701 domain-containing protein [Vibrio sp. SCSIO 43136]|uniref:DUF6701 domain-containing protein n=1 Tax=Vibrio sp. SCSIO 43136 TaxID=2819101 RepID=UPI0020760F46|nr:DUF6701 domain-containing protein [Vibrio sp. SCSIO 43136]USD67646.1 hypothetical protein J4N39_15770 [Vibrio sp. SCSIO 43136]
MARIVQLLLGSLILLAITMSSSAVALELEYGRYNVNAFPHADCINTVCTITFEETYATPPAVFFMDTVSFQNENDAPSAIRVLEVTTQQVRFQQQFPPDSRAPASMEQVPMTVIDYLVIEKGIHNFSGVSVLVGSVDTARYRTRITNDDGSGNRNNRERITYASIPNSPITSFSSAPAVLHQVQTVNNDDDLWLTSVVPSVNTTRFDIALERLEIDGREDREDREFPTETETIAYLVALGSGEKDGIKFQIRNEQTRSSLSTNQPVTQGCETFAEYDELDVVPVIIGKMNSRNGNNGGFARRCRLETDRASFMVDEDQDYDSERGHVAERIGFILFEVPFEVNQCTQFTGAAQTWSTDGEIALINSLTITGSVPDGRVGFDNLTQPDWGNNEPKFCDGYRCAADSSLKVPQYNFAAFTPSNTVLNPADGAVISPGEYKRIDIKNGRTVTLSAGDYFMEDFNVSGGATVIVTGKVRISAYKITLSGNSNVNYTTSGGSITSVPENLYLISHGIDNSVDYLNLNNNSSVKNGVYVSGSAKASAFVISESLVDINGGSTIIHGAVASLYLKMYGSGQLLGDISSCNDTTYTMGISPTSATELIDNAVAVTFSILNSQGITDTSVSGTFNLTHDGGADVCWKATETGSCINDSSALPFLAGSSTYYLYSSSQAEVNITATWVEMSSVTGSAGPYKFENNGYIFEPSPLLVIAGQDTDATIKAVDNNGDVITSYEGLKTLQLTATSKILPSSGTLDASLITTSVTFVQGEATITVNYPDAGKVSLSIQEASDGFKGDMQVHARPHTFAICNITSSGLNQGYTGTSSSGAGFAKAGETFSVVIKPLTWLGSAISADNSGDGSVDTITDGLCSHTTTPNYYTEGSQYAGVMISHALHTPSQGVAGALSQPATDQIYEFTNTSQASSGLTIDNLSWNEVGSLWLQAQYAAFALGGVEQGVAAIGRFYPYQFQVTSQVVSEGQSDFTYMEQGFSAQFQVTAQAVEQLAGGTSTTTTTNYEYLTNYQMSIHLKALDNDKITPAQNDLTSRLDTTGISQSGWESDWDGGVISVPLSTLKFDRVETQSTPRITTADGPYDLQLGLEVDSGNVDCAVSGCTTFDSHDTYRNDGSNTTDIASIGNALDMRFGRLYMPDLGAQSGQTIDVPLEAQYWNGSNFVTNTLDSESAFNGANYCREEIWPGGNTTAASLSGSGAVSTGESSALQAIQNQSGVREQVKLWLRIGVAQSGLESGLGCQGSNTAGLEYLFYNWDGRGDESPSAVYTFGVYRGNDRVIFRGEPRVY